MKGVLFIHNNFPGQFGFIADELVRRGVPVAAIAGEGGRTVPGIPLARWLKHPPATEGIFRPAARTELDFLAGRAAAECAVKLKEGGFEPDLIIGHPGKGGTLFLREVFPEAKQLIHGEFYYHPNGGDADFDPEFGRPSFDDKIRTQAHNAPLALAYAGADRIVCPTPFQKALLPPAFQDRASIIHEGVDTDRAKPRSDAAFMLEGGVVLDGSAPVITYVSRRFEPLRGFHIFLRALPKLLAEVPKAQVLLIGADEPNVYGLRAPEGTTWKSYFLNQMQGRLDLGRIHFTGPLPRDQMIAAMQISAAHVYYTYPFVLSWSLLEAMACECLVVASDTAPVRDAIQNRTNGILLDFFDPGALADALVEACRRPEAFTPLRRAARETVLREFDRNRKCLPEWLQMIGSLVPVPPG